MVFLIGVGGLGSNRLSFLGGISQGIVWRGLIWGANDGCSFHGVDTVFGFASMYRLVNWSRYLIELIRDRCAMPVHQLALLGVSIVRSTSGEPSRMYRTDKGDHLNGEHVRASRR